MEILDTRGLLALRTIADLGSVSAAAAQLGWSQPTVNHHLRNLERSLGSTLVARSPRGSRPTPVGQLVVSRASEILGLCHRLGAEVALWQESQTVPVRIGAVPTVGARVIPKLHYELQERPRWRTELTGTSAQGAEGASDAEAAGTSATGEDTEVKASLDVTMDEHAKLVTRLEAGELDLALLVATYTETAWIPPTLRATRLYSEQLFLCVPASVGPIPVDEVGLPDFTALLSQTWAFSIDRGDAIDEVILSFCRAAGFEPRVGMRLDDYAAIKRLIAAGLAVAMIPESSRPMDDDIEAVPMPLEACRRDVLLVTRADSVVGGRMGASGRRGGTPGGRRRDPIASAHDAAIAEVITDVTAVTREWR